MVVITTSIQNTHPIPEMYVFGDSLSDTGTVFKATGGMYPPNPPYFQGRYSNGQVWVEYLADFLYLSVAQTKNFAYGGATTGSDRNSYVPGLLAQIELFMQTQQQLDPKALYVIWAGANDYLQGERTATLPVENITKVIAFLADRGAKKLLVGNLPDLGQLPTTRTQANSASLSALTQAHNQSLRRSLKVLSQQYSELQLATLDANTLYREAIANPATFGFTNVINACLTGAGTTTPDKSLFWDGIHPTTAAHRVLGETAFSALNAAGMVNLDSVLLG